jgi:hypothetical protein
LALWHWRQRQFQSLKEAAEGASQFEEWRGYANYCHLLESGLRRRAHDALSAFIVTLKPQPFPERQAFVRWLLRRAHGAEAEQMLVPHQLTHGIVIPTLREWKANGVSSIELRKWRSYLRIKDAKQLVRADREA